MDVILFSYNWTVRVGLVKFSFVVPTLGSPKAKDFKLFDKYF